MQDMICIRVKSGEPFNLGTTHIFVISLFLFLEKIQILQTVCMKMGL